MAAKGREQGRPVLAEGRRCAASEVRSEPGADEVVSTTSSIWFGFECVIPSVYEVKWALAMDMLRWDDCDQTRLASAVEENIWSLCKNFALGEDSAFHDLYGARCLETPIKSHPYNFVMNFVGGKDFSGQIDKVFEHFGKRDTPFIWLMTSSSRPAHLSEHLQKRGMELAEVMPAMATWLDHIDTSQIATSSASKSPKPAQKTLMISSTLFHTGGTYLSNTEIWLLTCIGDLRSGRDGHRSGLGLRAATDWSSEKQYFISDPALLASML
jgi:hypothetical protein